MFYAQNKGLLIISLSQLLFSMMYMGVKVITVADTPVPTYEVCWSKITLRDSPDLFIVARRRADGNYMGLLSNLYVSIRISVIGV
jgi:hypothetical protein